MASQVWQILAIRRSGVADQAISLAQRTEAYQNAVIEVLIDSSSKTLWVCLEGMHQLPANFSQLRPAGNEFALSSFAHISLSSVLTNRRESLSSVHAKETHEQQKPKPSCAFVQPKQLTGKFAAGQSPWGCAERKGRRDAEQSHGDPATAGCTPAGTGRQAGGKLAAV